MKIHLTPLGRFLSKVFIIITTVMLCTIQLYRSQDADVISQNADVISHDADVISQDAAVISQDADVISEVLSLEYVKSVDDWPFGIKCARWDTDNEFPIDWDWLKILDKLLIPGQV